MMTFFIINRVFVVELGSFYCNFKCLEKIKKYHSESEFTENELVKVTSYPHPR